MSTSKRPGPTSSRPGSDGDPLGFGLPASDRVPQVEHPAPRRTFADEITPEIEPDWLRRRRIKRQAVPLEQWRQPALTDARQATEADRSARLALSASEVALAAVPLVVGLILLFLGFGPAR